MPHTFTVATNAPALGEAHRLGLEHAADVQVSLSPGKSLSEKC